MSEENDISKLNLEDDYLQLSGIQHFSFCPRQWGLIHLEDQWQENLLTMQGEILHERVDDSFERETRGGLIVTRAMKLVSHELRLSGQADAVEFHRLSGSTAGITLEGQQGLWQPRPVEYKRGKPKADNIDAVQLCAQAMCLEEMLGVSIVEGDLFYAATRRRERVQFTGQLREEVACLAEAMWQAFVRGQTPLGKKGKQCQACSLVDVCLPVLGKKRRSVKAYLADALAD